MTDPRPDDRCTCSPLSGPPDNECPEHGITRPPQADPRIDPRLITDEAAEIVAREFGDAYIVRARRALEKAWPVMLRAAREAGLAYMTPQAQAVLHASCRRMVAALEQLNPELTEAKGVHDA